LSLVLSQVGFKTHQLVGGYKSFRGRVLAELARQTETLQVVLVRGRTGSGKTRLLQALAAEGGQILDLEALAAHRGSVLGGLPGQPQPSQKAFETAIWQRLDELDLRLPVFVESESRRIGALHLPNPLMLRMQQASRVIHVEMPEEARIALLLDDYRSLTTAPEDFCACIQGLMGLQSRGTVAHWQSLAREGGWLQLLTELLQQHYDPLYDRHAPKETVSGPRHEHLRLPSHDAASLAAAAQALLHATPGEP
jgi:tRNA 2-selenouridine synthase